MTDPTGPYFISGRAIVELAAPVERLGDVADRFIREVKVAFPTVASRQQLAPETPLQVPHLFLQSTACRLATSALGGELSVRYYGDFTTDVERCVSYLRDKTSSVIDGWIAIGARPSVLGLVLGSNFTFASYEVAASRLITHHLKVESSMPLTDAAVRVSTEVDGKYYASVALSVYKQAELLRPFTPGLHLVVKQWEATIKQVGITSEIDINNRLESLTRRTDSTVDSVELDRLVAILLRMQSAVPEYINSGSLVIRPDVRTASATG